MSGPSLLIESTANVLLASEIWPPLYSKQWAKNVALTIVKLYRNSMIASELRDWNHRWDNCQLSTVCYPAPHGKSVSCLILLHLGSILSVYSDWTSCKPHSIYGFTLGIKGCSLLVNLRDRDNLPTNDKIPAPNVSVDYLEVHCSLKQLSNLSPINAHHCLHMHLHKIACCESMYWESGV